MAILNKMGNLRKLHVKSGLFVVLRNSSAILGIDKNTQLLWTGNAFDRGRNVIIMTSNMTIHKESAIFVREHGCHVRAHELLRRYFVFVCAMKTDQNIFRPDNQSLCNLLPILIVSIIH